MPQGASYGKKKLSGKENKKKVSYSHKRSAKKYTKKGNPTVEIRRGCSGFKKNGDKHVTGLINSNIEQVMASRVMQNGSTFSMRDIKNSGKDRLKQVNQQALTKKKGRIEQKLEQTQQKLNEL